MTHNTAIHAVAGAGEGKDRSFNRITLHWVKEFSKSIKNWPSLPLFYWMTSFPFPSDVIRPGPLRPSYHRYDIVACRDVAFDNAKKFGVAFLYGLYQRNDFEFIPVVKMEMRHPVEGWFGNEYSSICNHCGVMAAWSRKLSEKKFDFLRFLEKWPVTG